MNKIFKGNNRFATDFNKSIEESTKNEHPLPETIHLYAMRDLPIGRMEELKEHLEYCWDCNEILAEAEEMQRICEEIASGNLKIEGKIPNFDELYEKAFGRPETEKIIFPGQIQESLKGLMAFLFREPQWGAPSDIPNFSYELLWKGKLRPLHFWKLEKGFQVLTSDPELIGSFIVLRDKTENIEIKSRFVDDDLTQEGIKASAFLRVEEESSFQKLKEKHQLSNEFFPPEIMEA